MELNHLKYFYVVAKEGGFTRAAKILRVQQPAISKMVRQLEDRLGVVLLERHKRSVKTTKAGEEIYRKCEEIFRAVEDISMLSEREQTDCHGPLQFGASDSISVHLIPFLLKSFLKAHAKVRPSIFTGTSNLICSEILTGRIEFGLFFTTPDDDAFEVTELIPVPFKLVIASKCADDAKIRRSFIGSREIDYPKIRSFPVLEMLRKEKLQPEITISSNNLDSHKQMVLQGLGFSLLPSFMVRNEIKNGKLKTLHDEKKFIYPLKLVVRKNKVLSRNAKVFLDEVQRRVSEFIS